MNRSERLHARRRRTRISFSGFLIALIAVTASVAGWRLHLFGGGDATRPAARDGRGGGIEIPGGATVTPSPTPTPSAPALPAGPGPINTKIAGLTTFRGNATRTYYGQGPVPKDPKIIWRYTGGSAGDLCSSSENKGETKVWCGTGWTGQPNVVEWKGKTQVRFGAYSGAVHVVNGATGEDMKRPFQTGDIIKGTVTSDPDGYPLLYSGSRDNYFRILALDRGKRMEELWKLSADSAPNQVWNDDWDSSPLVIGDYLLEGGENSWFYVVKLNRGYGPDGKVKVDPQVRAVFPGYDDQLFADVGDQEVSIENSPAFRDGIVYFANSGGLVQGWDVSAVLKGGKKVERVFRYWTGEDTDATVVIDEDGFLYAASELERFNARSEEAGQLVKLDPSKPDDPVVWKKRIPGNGGDGGIWATPGLHAETVFVTTNTGRLLALKMENGKKRWEIDLPPPTWTSPVIVDGVLIVGDCEGNLRAYDVTDPTKKPDQIWKVKLEGCIEATPAVWKGMVYVGARGGAVYGIGDEV